MRNWIKLLVILCSIVSVSCSSSPSINSMNDWEQRTVQKVLNSKNIDGGYAILNDERDVSIYDTRFALELFIEGNHDIPRKRELEQYIKVLQIENLDLGNEDDLIHIRHIVKICSILNVEFDNKFKNFIEHKLLELQKDDGLFAFSSDDQLLDKITVTELSMEILKDIEINYDNARIQASIINIIENNEIENIGTHFKPTVYNSVLNILKLTGYENPKDLKEINNLMVHIMKSSFNKPENKLEMYNIIANMNILKELEIQPVLHPELINYLEEIRLKDGGFNFLNDDISDLQATVDVLRFYKKNKFLDSLLINIKYYQLDSGAIGIRSPLTSDIQSTIFANKILADLSYDNLDDTNKFLQNSQPETSKEVFILKEYNDNLSKSYEVAFNNTLGKNLDRELLYRILVSKSSLEEKQFVKDYLSENPEFWLTSRLEVTYLVVRSINTGEIKHSLDYKKLGLWLISLQKDDGGISNNRDFSDLIETYYALLIMRHIEVSPDKIALESYINNLKVISGGYSFVKNGSANLLATYYALQCKKMLESSL